MLPMRLFTAACFAVLFLSVVTSNEVSNNLLDSLDLQLGDSVEQFDVKLLEEEEVDPFELLNDLLSATDQESVALGFHGNVEVSVTVPDCADNPPGGTCEGIPPAGLCTCLGVNESICTCAGGVLGVYYTCACKIGLCFKDAILPVVKKAALALNGVVPGLGTVLSFMITLLDRVGAFECICNAYGENSGNPLGEFFSCAKDSAGNSCGSHFNQCSGGDSESIVSAIGDYLLCLVTGALPTFIADVSYCIMCKAIQMIVETINAMIDSLWPSILGDGCKPNLDDLLCDGAPAALEVFKPIHKTGLQAHHLDEQAARKYTMSIFNVAVLAAQDRKRMYSEALENGHDFPLGGGVALQTGMKQEDAELPECCDPGTCCNINDNCGTEPTCDSPCPGDRCPNMGENTESTDSPDTPGWQGCDTDLEILAEEYEGGDWNDALQESTKARHVNGEPQLGSGWFHPLHLEVQDRWLQFQAWKRVDFDYGDLDRVSWLSGLPKQTQHDLLDELYLNLAKTAPIAIESGVLLEHSKSSALQLEHQWRLEEMNAEVRAFLSDGVTPMNLEAFLSPGQVIPGTGGRSAALQTGDGVDLTGVSVNAIIKLLQCFWKIYLSKYRIWEVYLDDWHFPKMRRRTLTFPWPETVVETAIADKPCTGKIIDAMKGLISQDENGDWTGAFGGVLAMKDAADGQQAYCWTTGFVHCTAYEKFVSGLICAVARGLKAVSDIIDALLACFKCLCESIGALNTCRNLCGLWPVSSLSTSIKNRICKCDTYDGYESGFPKGVNPCDVPKLLCIQEISDCMGCMAIALADCATDVCECTACAGGEPPVGGTYAERIECGAPPPEEGACAQVPEIVPENPPPPPEATGAAALQTAIHTDTIVTEDDDYAPYMP